MPLKDTLVDSFTRVLSRSISLIPFVPFDFAYDNIEAYYDARSNAYLDLSGNGLHLTNINTGTQNNGIGNGIGYTFNGVDQYITADQLATFATGNDETFTLHITFKLNTTTGNQTIFSFGRLDTSSTPMFQFYSNGTNFIFQKTDDSAGNASTTMQPVDTQTHVLTLVRNTTTISVWLDGGLRLSGSSNNVGATTLDGFTLGALRKHSTLTNFMNGSVGQMLFYSDVQSNAEIRGIQRELTETIFPERPTTMDILLIAGQSNAEGQGTAAESPAMNVGVGYQFSGSGNRFIERLSDPIGDANTGSAWPSWANTWFELTGRGTLFAEGAVGSSALIYEASTSGGGTASGGHWDKTEPTGNKYTSSAGLFDDIVTTVSANTIFDLGFTNLIWAQGESDAAGINGSTVTAAIYETDLDTLFTNFDNDVTGGVDNFFISLLGLRGDMTLETEYDAIRGAQENVVTSRSDTYTVFSNAQNFPDEGKLKVDNIHYNQTGLNEMGFVGATTAVSFLTFN